MFNFNEIANTKVADVKPVPLAPVGTYRWRVTKLPVIRDFTSSKDGIEYQSVDFPVQIVAPLEDVDPSEYPGELTDIRQTVSFLFDKKDEVAFARAQNNVKRFMVEHLKAGDEDMSFKELMNNSVNQQFIAPIQWKPRRNDPEQLEANIGRTAPLD
jgi:hypothetical protein